MDDARLKRYFDALREQDSRAAPDFMDLVLSARRVKPKSRTTMTAVVLLAACALAAVIMISRPHQPPKVPGSLMTWSSPTAFLLETPGQQFLSETPPLGSRMIYGLPGARKEIK